MQWSSEKKSEKNVILKVNKRQTHTRRVTDVVTLTVDFILVLFEWMPV